MVRTGGPGSCNNSTSDSIMDMMKEIGGRNIYMAKADSKIQSSV